MIPREAFTLVKEVVIAVHEQIGIVQNGKTSTAPIEALAVLERLVSKDESDRKFAEDHKPVAYSRLRVPAALCTCGSATPCEVWGHT